MDWTQALAGSPLGEFLRGPSWAYPLANGMHILSLGLVFGAIATLDARLLGAFARTPVQSLGPVLSSAAALGVVMAGVTGFALFSVRPDAYLDNPAFLAKLALIAAAVANALALRIGGDWRAACAEGRVSPRLRAHAALSLSLWIGAILAGRWIGFLQ